MRGDDERRCAASSRPTIYHRLHTPHGPHHRRPAVGQPSTIDSYSRCEETGWDGIGWDGMGWDGMGWLGI
jgi:hypothetical protein